jgi:hypothetical protein
MREGITMQREMRTPLEKLAQQVCQMLEEDFAPNYETHLWDVINAITYQEVESWPLKARQFYLMTLGEYADGMQILRYTTNPATVAVFEEFYDVVKKWGDEPEEVEG